MPITLTFRGQRDGEIISLVIRRHPWTLIRPGLLLMLGLAMVILMFVWFKASAPAIWTLLLVGGASTLYALYAWFVWWNTVYLLTDQRMILITQRGLFSRRIEDYSLDKIQSVASDTDGPAGTFLNFGTVMLAIMGIKEPVAMPGVEDPYSVQEKALSAIKAATSPVHRYDKPDKPDTSDKPDKPSRKLAINKEPR